MESGFVINFDRKGGSKKRYYIMSVLFVKIVMIIVFFSNEDQNTKGKYTFRTLKYNSFPYLSYQGKNAKY